MSIRITLVRELRTSIEVTPDEIADVLQSFRDYEDTEAFEGGEDDWRVIEIEDENGNEIAIPNGTRDAREWARNALVGIRS